MGELPDEDEIVSGKNGVTNNASGQAGVSARSESGSIQRGFFNRPKRKPGEAALGVQKPAECASEAVSSSNHVSKIDAKDCPMDGQNDDGPATRQTSELLDTFRARLLATVGR